MDFLKEVGEFTPRQLMANLIHKAQDHGDLMEDTSAVQTYVLAQRSARLSVSKYPSTGDVIVTVLYGNESIYHSLVLWKHPDGKIILTLH